MSRVERAVERLYEDAALRDELTDDEAEQLLAWAEAQITHLDETMPDDATFDARFDALRALVKGTNRFVGLRAEMDDTARQARFDALAETASALGVHAAGAQADGILTQLDGLDNPAAIRLLTLLFTPSETPNGDSTPETPTASSRPAWTTPASSPTAFDTGEASADGETQNDQPE